MKKYFDIIETVKYSHRVEIEIEESLEDDYEEFAEETACEMERGCYGSKEEIFNEFIKAFGEEKVNTTIDGSPRTEFEAC